MSLIPATILTGFLGSGKTTLLKRVLTEAHGQKIAVIENEFGEENIDNEILVQDAKEQIIQLNNGCVCCTIREDLRTTLSDLAEKKRKGELDFERVVIETTGLADPGPVAQTFFMDDEIAETYLLDSILTLVDAKHGDQQLDARQEARRQVGFRQRRRDHGQDIVARRQRPAERGGARGQRRHAGHHLDPEARRQAREQVHERAIEERIALAQDRDVASGLEVAAELARGRVVGRLRGEARGLDRHADRDLDRRAVGEMRGGDAARQAVAGLGRRIGDHGTGAQPMQRLERDELGIARPDAQAVSGAAHLRTVSWVTGMAGRQPR